MLFVLSVGGGDLERNISPNLVRALEYAKKAGRDDLRHRRPRRRLHGEGRRRLRPHPHRQPAHRHPARRGVPGRRLAPARLAPVGEPANHEVGVGRAMKGTRKRRAVFLDRDGVLIRTSVRDGMPHPVEQRRRGGDPARRAGSPPPAGRAGSARRIVVTNQPDVAPRRRRAKPWRRSTLTCCGNCP